MRFRSFAAFVLSLLVAVSAFALDAGKAEGTITINDKPIKLKYSFAKKEKDFDKNDRWVVVLTDRALSRSVINDDMRFSKAVENNEVAAAIFRFDQNKAIENIELKSKALKHKGLPFMTSNVKLTGIAFTKDAIEGAAASTEESEFFDDVASFSVKFKAPLGAEGKFGENAASAAELAASRPKIADGAALGTLTIDGKKIKLTHAAARTKPNSFDEKKTDVFLLLTNKAVEKEMLTDSQKLFAALDGGLRGIQLTIDADEKPYHMQLLHPEAPVQLTGSGFWNFDATDYSAKHVTARFFTTETQDFMDKHKYAYDVTFAVPVQAIKAADEITVDASSGTKLPAGGGEPGKAYVAFDKAIRSGNLVELKKQASKDRPLPELSAEETKQMLEMLKLMRPAKMKVTGGYVAGDRATLSVEGIDNDSKAKVTGTIEMALEDGLWKIVAEKWRQ
jgi:hypothetical protein